MRIHWMVFVLFAACGGDDSLDPEVVTNLPPGDATGTGASGEWQFESITTGCSGTCATEIDGFFVSACDVGTRLDEDAVVTQTDGVLVIDVDDSEYVSRLEGGIDADGSYEVGGLRTQLGGEVVITARSIGVVAGDTLTGTARVAVRGNGLDCLIEADANGTR